MYPKKIIIKKDCALAWILFMLYPLASIPFFFKGMLNFEKWSFVLFACFMGLLGILFPPTGDFYRYTMDYFTVSDMNWEQFQSFLERKQEWMLPYISFLLSHIGIHFDISRFLYNFLAYYMLGIIFLDIVLKNSDIKKNLSIYLCGMFFTFTMSQFLFRFFFSMILFTYGSYFVIYRNKKFGWVFVFLAILNHFSFLLFFVILLFAKMKIFKFSKTIVIILVMMCFFVNGEIAIKLFSFLPVDIVNHYSTYLDGYWAGRYLDDHSLKFRISQWLSSSITIASTVIYILTYKKNEECNLVNGILLLTCLASPFSTIVGRFNTVLILSIKTKFLYYYNSTRKQMICLYTLFFLTIIANFLGLWSNRRQLAISNMSKIVYSSTPQIIFHSYSEKWIHRHVFEDGGFK